MTDESDSKASQRVSQKYGELGAEEPPRALDEAILAASRRAVRTHPAPLVAPTGRRAWFVPLAAAAILMLAVGVTLHMQLEQPDIGGTSPPAESARVAPAPKAAAVEEQRTADSAARDRPQAASREVARSRSVREQAPEPGAAGADLTVQKDKIEARQAPQASGRFESAAPVTPPAPAAAVAAEPAPQRAAGESLAKRMDEAAQTPEKELERIAELRRAGRHDEADRALAEFRKRYPEFKIPEAMLERVERR